MRVRTLRITEKLAGRSVHDLLKNELLLSDALISRLKRRENGILVNGERAYTTRRAESGDLITAEVGDGPDAVRQTPIQAPLSVLYEDEDYIVIDKAAGMTVHASTRTPDECTVENALSAYLKPSEIAHPVSRLDRGTTGAMLLAKSGYAHELMRRIQHTPDFYREYRAVAHGIPAPVTGEIRLPIGFAPGSRYQRAADLDGAPACTRYEVLAAADRFCYLKLLPETGRTHQLRVHMAAVNCPLVGDWLYGREEPERIARPALHSFLLTFRHPLSGERHTVTAPLPADFLRLLEAVKLLPQSTSR